MQPTGHIRVKKGTPSPPPPARKAVKEATAGPALTKRDGQPLAASRGPVAFQADLHLLLPVRAWGGVGRGVP